MLTGVQKTQQAHMIHCQLSQLVSYIYLYADLCTSMSALGLFQRRQSKWQLWM